MKNWPRYTKWRKEERKRKRSEYLLALAERLPDWNIGSLRHMQFLAKRRHEQYDHMSVQCPAGITVSPAFLTFYDLYFTEDFIALERGLINLLGSGIKSEPFWQSPQDEIPELLQTWRTRPGSGSWHRIGHMTFEKCAWRPDTFKALSIDVIQISPTCINLVVSAYPSDSFRERFSGIISSEVQYTTIVNSFGIFPRRWQSANLLPSQVRQSELEELFLDLNREVVLLLRKYIGRGWAATGPLPSVQCFAFTQESDVDLNDKSFSEFCRSLSLTRIPSLHYTNGCGVDIIHPRRLMDKGTFTTPFRILVDSAAYLTKARTEMYANSESALFHGLEDKFIHPLVPFLALREHSHRAVEVISDYRDRLSPHIAIKKKLVRRMWSSIRLIRVSLTSVPLRLNSMRFFLARVTESTVQQFLSRPTDTDFRRETAKDTDTGLFATDLRHETEYLNNHASEQLNILRDAYHDLWNFSIQWILMILSIAGVLIAIAQFIPNEQDAQPSSESTSTKQLDSADG